MKRRSAIQLGLAAAALPSFAIHSFTKNGQKDERPNILFLMADQHRGDCIGADGHPAVQTPNLDRLAQEGAHFRCAYSSTPTCTPARAALLTGLSPWNHGMLGYAKVAEAYPFEKPKAMREAGYSTMCIGKNHFAPQRNYHGYERALLDESGREQSIDFRSDYRSWFYSTAPCQNPDETGIGWNDYRAKTYALPERLHPTHWTGESAVRFLTNYDHAQPFFLKVSFARPHSPYDPPERFMRMYENRDIPKAYAGDWASHYAERSDSSFSIWHGDMGEDQVRQSRQGYYGSISFIDEWIGRIVGVLEEKGILENTLIIYLADHGDMTGDHHLWRKSYAYESSARIPMILRWPDSILSAPRGQVLRHPVELRDVLPTFLDAASIPAPDHLDGRSLLKLARGETQNWREYIDLEHDVCYSKTNHWNALTDGRQKYIFHAYDGQEQMFDLENDLHELHDLAGDADHAGPLRTWRNRMIEHLSERGGEWVKNGRLALRPERRLHSPNYPNPQNK
ncbi:MAG: arylsulfatase [Candidatus Omnitrophica bacterium]|nr:arylsulfatase [Candidatus Omnitrophota bacterium]